MEKVRTEAEAHLEENSYKVPHNLHSETKNSGCHSLFIDRKLVYAVL